MSHRRSYDSRGRPQCTRCGEFKEASEFAKNRQKWDGLDLRCRPCKRAEHEKYRRSHGVKSRDEYEREVSRYGECPDCGKHDRLWNFQRGSDVWVCPPCYGGRRIRRYWRRIKDTAPRHETKKEYARQYMLQYRSMNRSDPYFIQKERARKRVRDALKTGRIERQPCEICGHTKTDAHHEDYAKPLDVRWLCRDCHSALHQRQRAESEPA